jgi:hypothetical protein
VVNLGDVRVPDAVNLLVVVVRDADRLLAHENL